jgi:hypothetical protein
MVRFQVHSCRMNCVHTMYTEQEEFTTTSDIILFCSVQTSQTQVCVCPGRTLNLSCRLGLCICCPDYNYHIIYSLVTVSSIVPTRLSRFYSIVIEGIAPYPTQL